MIRHRLGHAILLITQDDGNKKAMAHYFAMMLLCQKRETKDEMLVPCGSCNDCYQISLQQHSNIEWILPAESDEIRIAQIREVRERLRLSSFDNRARLVVLMNAHTLTLQAANALLKSIEEPNHEQYFLLIATSSSALPRTLVSRCQKLIIAAKNQNPVEPGSDKDLSQYAENLLVRIRNSDLNSRISIIEEIIKHACDKTHLLLELQKIILQELRRNSALLTKSQRYLTLKSLEATEYSRHLLEHNGNLQLSLEHWLLNAWPIQTP